MYYISHNIEKQEVSQNLHSLGNIITILFENEESLLEVEIDADNLVRS